MSAAPAAARGADSWFPILGDLPLPEIAASAFHCALLVAALFQLAFPRSYHSSLLCYLLCFKSDTAADDRVPAPATAVRPRFVAAGACCGYVLSVQFLLLCWEAVGFIRGGGAWAPLLLPGVQTAAWLALGLLVWRCRRKALSQFPMLVRLWWVLSFILCSYISCVDSILLMSNKTEVSAHMVTNFAAMPVLFFLGTVAVFGGSTGVVITTDDLLRQPLIASEERLAIGAATVTPFHNAWLFSLMTLSWLSPVLQLGAQRPLQLPDIPQLPHKDRAKSCFKTLNANWERLVSQQSGKRSSLALAIFLSHWKEAVKSGAFAAVNASVQYVGPYLVSDFVNYLCGRAAYRHQGYVLVAVIFGAKLVETLTGRQWDVRVDLMGIRLKSALTALVYRKGLRLSSTARQRHSSGEIVNYMAVDAQKVGDFAWYFHDLWLLPLQTILGLLILYKKVGVAALATLVAMIVCISVSIPMANLQEHYQGKLMDTKDTRMRKTAECLRSMRVLKLQAWEERYRLGLEELREEECKRLRWVLYWQSAVTFIFWSSPIFVSVATFGTCIFLGGQLTAGSVLSALATLRILQDPMRSFPDLFNNIVQTRVALQRVTDYLHIEELPDDATIRMNPDSTDKAIEIINGTFSWDQIVSMPTLSNIQLSIKRGMRVAICGAVGSGKSSFISCLLGEIPKIFGEVRVSGAVAYVPQTPWIQSGTIEDNIIFGSAMERSRYQHVICACSLERDLDLLPNGDQTLIGERGINLSGGQKQRVQLARALYQDADIYLLDDPFSAVDAHTGSELFKEYILTSLANKTVLYVTHQVEFLPAADLILVFKDGHITQAGKYDYLLQSGTDFNTLVAAHREAIETIKIGDCSHAADIFAVPKKKLMKSTSIIDVGQNELPEEAQSSIPHAANQNEIRLASKSCNVKDEEERLTGKIKFIVYLSYLMAAYKGVMMLLIILAQTLFQLLQIASNWWMAWANPEMPGDKPKTSNTELLAVYMALAFGSSFFVFLRSIFVATFGIAAAQKLFLKMLRSIFSAPMAFFDTTPSGRILNRVSSDQNVVDLDLPSRVGGFVATTVQLFGIVAVMSKVTWQVLALMIPMAVICWRMQRYYMASARELTRIIGIQKSPILQHFGESIAGAATIRGFGQEKRFMKRNLFLLDCSSRPAFYNLAAIEWLTLRMEFVSTFVFALSMIILLSFPPGTIDPSMAGLAVTYGLNLNNRISRWILSFCKLENKIISLERIKQYSELPSEAPLIIEDCRPESFWPEIGSITFVDLKLRYNEASPLVLRGISCAIPGSKKIGIVGRTGSGKSTLIHALFRLIEPSNGKIIIDSIDICSIGLHDLRSRLSIIPQEPTLFEGNIRMNLDPLEQHTDAAIWEALDKCQLGWVIRAKPEKLDTPVLENGENWSVGQRQLLSLGRALLKRAKILVLDEATASVDTATDNLIQRIIRSEFKDCTVLTIAHRIPTVIDSDLVLVLSDGAVAEFDEPMTLLKDRSSMFAQLVAEYSARSSFLDD